jgi:hypothetical protein
LLPFCRGIGLEERVDQFEDDPAESGDVLRAFGGETEIAEALGEGHS